MERNRIRTYIVETRKREARRVLPLLISKYHFCGRHVGRMR
ncbi:hypothetical protein HMPREF1146_1060 [Prevotella sp. MSX73]|nr:hypothetical protein HMPREF1146_1060 [Prevotella sp. MSX73]